jgi:hypothetical protein
MCNAKLAARRWLHWLLGSLMILIAALVVAACGSTPTPAATPQASAAGPTAPVLIPEGEITIKPGEQLAVRASAPGATRYEWTLTGAGKLDGTTGPAAIYTAPTEGEGLAVLNVIAYTGETASAPASLVIKSPTSTAVRLDALAIPAGWMSGGGAPGSNITLTNGGTNCNTGADCMRIEYKPGGNFGGIYWWPLGCGEQGTDAAWQQVRAGSCGIDVGKVAALSAVDHLTFWARGEKGGEVIEFKIGAADIAPAPGRSLGKVALKPTWQQYSLDLSGMDLTNAVGLFAWIAADIDNPQGAVFYLDDIQLEGAK